ncbi:MAG: prephenate dehydrogenase/arogenate dehydrogenase family protein [Pseudomonadota bacterium]
MHGNDNDIDFAELRALRERLDGVDRALVETIAERQKLVADIGALKSARGHQTRDFRRERAVLERVSATAEAAGLDAGLATDVLALLIRASLQHQEQARVRAEGTGGGQSVLIVGGAGRMGRWFREFFHSQGFQTAVADPAADPEAPGNYADLASAGVDYDIIVVATTLARSADVLDALVELAPRGLIFDVGSLKSPLRKPLERLAEAGLRVTSVHPMFGPDTQLLAGKHVIFVDVGHAEATATARDLFASTMASCVDMDLDQHDRVIADVLGLSHATGIAFADALASSASVPHGVTQMTSPTFDAQLETASKVLHESPELYYEIQKLNDYGLDALERLATSVNRLRDAVRDGKHDTFIDIMRDGRRFIDEDIG